jgi:hypothetical protein
MVTLCFDYDISVVTNLLDRDFSATAPSQITSRIDLTSRSAHWPRTDAPLGGGSEHLSDSVPACHHICQVGLGYPPVVIQVPG